MSGTRKGVLTPEQEKTLDRLLKFKNKLAEAADGNAISLIDNQGIERLKSQIEEKHPGMVEELVYPIVDAIFDGLATIAEDAA